MARKEMSSVSFSDIEDAFLFVGFAPYGTNAAYLNVETGQILYQSEMADIDEIGDEEMDWDQMVEIPHKNDLDLGQSLETLAEELYDADADKWNSTMPSIGSLPGT